MSLPLLPALPAEPDLGAMRDGGRWVYGWGVCWERDRGVVPECAAWL